MSTLRVALLRLVCLPTLACRTQDALDVPDDVGNDAFEVVPVDTGLILLDAEVAMAMRAYSGR